MELAIDIHFAKSGIFKWLVSYLSIPYLVKTSFCCRSVISRSGFKDEPDG